MKNKDCVFCKIINKKIPSYIIFEDKLVIAFLDIQPINNGHVLIIPKNHYALISDVDDTVAARMFNVAQKINAAIRKSNIKAEGLNFWLADGEAAFQTVFHAHLHCIPRFRDDGFKLLFPDGFHNPPTQEQLSSVATDIKKHL
ncbi:MAG: HIT family protein [Spirochaetia bacterium]|jgi:histidine triad (HIT) family protein|nr:HIT family protein [Spirochaetia bacterium]